ncbi:hypothetical protein CI102_9238, partial [Trichoderma harzianum]
MANSIEIFGAVNNVLGLGSRIYNFFSDVKDAPEEVRQMCAQLQSLQKLLPEIERAAFDLVHAMPLSLETILTCLKGCETDFNTLCLAVEPLRTKRGIIWRDALNKIAASVKWVVKTEELEKFTKNLETAKQTLVLAMFLAGMRIDRVVLNEISSVDTKLDKYERAINSHLDDVHKRIVFQLKQSEYRFLKRIDILSRAAAEIHGQNNFRVTELYNSITPTEPLRTDNELIVQSVDSNVDFVLSSSGTPEIGLVDFPLENQQANIADQAKQKDMEDLDPLLTELQDVMRRWEAAANDFENIRPPAPGLREHKEAKELQAKWHNRFGGTFEKNEDKLTQKVLLLDTTTAVTPAVGRWAERYKIIGEVLYEMQDALETCTREYELYPEPKLKFIIVELYTESFLGMIAMLNALRPRLRVSDYGLSKLTDLEDSIARIRRSSQKVMKEVDYLHRRELRQAHLRLREIDKKQDQVIRALEEQKKILISMQEEQKALNLINDHQKVVQMLQQLLVKFPPPAAVG